MLELRNQLATSLLEAYTANFDITPITDDTSLFARCDYHSRDAQYVLIRKAELWASENHEYLYLHNLSTANISVVNKIMQDTLTDGEPRIIPHAQHMFTHLSAVILCDQIDSDTIAHLKSMKKHRSFWLSLHGWMEFKIAVVDVTTGQIFTNRAGKQLAADLNSFVTKELKLFYKREENTK